jgi:hypothetical protein
VDGVTLATSITMIRAGVLHGTVMVRSLLAASADGAVVSAAVVSTVAPMTPVAQAVPGGPMSFLGGAGPNSNEPFRRSRSFR